VGHDAEVWEATGLNDQSYGLYQYPGGLVVVLANAC